MKESENKFLAIIKENEIDVTEGNQLAVKFTGFMDKMAEIEVGAKSIVVTDVSQKEEMKKARELRLALKEMRVDSEKVRVGLKEDSLKRGKVIDAIAKIVKDAIIPLEQYLESQEKFAENLEKQRIEQVRSERFKRLYAVSDPSLYKFEDMGDEIFEALMVGLEKTHNEKIEAEKKSENDRIEKARIEKEEAEKNKMELDRMKVEEEDRKKREAVEAEDRRKKTLEEEEAKRKIEAERKAEEDERERKHQAELKAEREKAESLEKEKRDREEADRKGKADAEEAERQKSLAPEKDKLFAFAEKIKSIESPQGLSVAGLNIVKEAEQKLLGISQEIKEALKTL